MQRPCMDFSRDVEQVLKRAGSLAEQLRQPLLPLTAEVRETVKEIKRRTLAMEPVVGAAAYYVGYTYMAGLNGRYWDFPRSDMVSKALTLWFQDSLNRQKTAMALTEQ